MDKRYLSRQQIKRQAKQTLRQAGIYRQLVVANLIPWAIGVAFSLLGLYTAYQLVVHFGVANVAANPANFVDYYQGNSDTANQSLLKAVAMLWFTHGLAFTALDLMRRRTAEVNPLQAVLRLFDSRYFFGVLAIYCFTMLALICGLIAFFVPMIIISLGLSMAYYVYYDGREHEQPGQYFTAFGAVRLSWRVMRGHKFDYFVLQLTLLGWTLLEYFTLHVFDCLINPYLQLVDAGFYNNVRQQYDDEQAMMPLD